MNPNPEQSVALVLAAHGDRGGDARNQGLAAHVAALAAQNRFVSVTGGVLNGEPALEEALARADASGASQIVIYPLFMSAGYFVKTVLADRVSAAGLRTPTGIMQPLGLDKRAALLMLENALRASKSAGVDPAAARLLIVGHGSKYGADNAEATKRAARLLSPHSPFARVETAFIEEAPFVSDALGHYAGLSVVAGFLSGDGMHASEDVPEAIRQSGSRALYTGPVGLHPRVPELIASSVHNALSAPDETPADAPASATAPPPAPPAAAAPGVGPGGTAGPTPEPGEPAPRQQEKGRRRSGPVRLLVKAAAAIVLVAALAFGAAAFLVPEDVVRDQVASLVKQHTGRNLVIRGKTSFAVFPNVGVEMEDVSVSNPEGMAGGDVLRMDSLNLNLKLLPLLTRRVEIDRFVLVRPEFHLLVDANGRKNWDLQKAAAARALPLRTHVALHEAAPRPAVSHAQAGGLGGGMVQDISLGTVKISDGAVNYTDERAGTKRRVEAVNVTLVQPERSDPLSAEGDLVWQGEKVSFEGTLNTVSALLRDEPSKTRVAVTTRLGKGSFDGQVALGPAFSGNGAVTADTPSLRTLASWLGNPLPPGGGLGPVSVSGHLGVAGETVTFTKAKIGLDGMKGDGQVSVRMKGVRPYINASLTLDKLDVNPYLADAPAGAGQPAAAPGAPAARTAAPAEPAPEAGAGGSLTDFIENLNKTDKNTGAPAPQVRAWSERAMNFAGLRAVDADLKLITQAIHYRNIKTGPSDVTATLKSGVLTADLSRLALYSGTGTGRVTLNGARAVPAVAAIFNLNNISALPLLKDVAGFKWVSGRANIALSVSGTGNAQSEIMRSLQGQGQFAFGDGAIEGINIPAMVRGLKQGKLDGWKRNEREKTDFSQLSASFRVQQGVASNKDLNLVGPLVRMTGEGNIDLGRERIDYSALPRIVASLEGQGAATDPNRGIAVPVRIIGPWDSPKIAPDLERLLRDPELAEDTARKVGKVLKKLKNKEDVNKLLQGVLGGGNQTAPDGAEQGGSEKVDPNEVLKKLFR